MVRRIIFLSILQVACSATLRAQDTPDDTPAMPIYVQVGKVAYGADSIPQIITPTLYKYPALAFRSEKEREKYNRLVYNVKKLLPLAKMARYTLLETYEYLETLPDKKSREAHVRLVEAELKRTYAPVIKKMSRQQGRLLLKLIDRECNQTGYSIAKAFVGTLRANVYQSIGLLFGNSLSRHYDPEGDDRYTERVVRMVESGQL
ncbi:MAG: DUF4294 domain-containing protein [Alloprevotella sp.]|nr:DUF4294 domain-containing protein [Alloprevotella sp.]